MNKKLWKVLLCTMMLVGVMCIGGCSAGEKDRDNDEPEKEEETELPENTIVVVNYHINEAWGYAHNGMFIDSEGEVYLFSFDQEEYRGVGNTPMMEKLEIIHQYAKPATTIDVTLVQKLYERGMQISAEETYETENVACDAGAHVLSFYNDREQKLVRCRETGDNEGELESRAGRNFIKYFDRSILGAISEQNEKQEYNPAKAYYYGADDLFIKNYHGYMGSRFTMLIDGKDDLEELEATFGDDLGISDWYGKEGMDRIFDSYVFYVQYDSVSSTGYNLIKKGIFIQEDRIFFISDPASTAPGPEDIVGEMMDGFFYIGAIPGFCLKK